MMYFTVSTLSRNTLGLRELLERFATEQWIPALYTRQEAEELVFDTSSSEFLPLYLSCW